MVIRHWTKARLIRGVVCCGQGCWPPPRSLLLTLRGTNHSSPLSSTSKTHDLFLISGTIPSTLALILHCILFVTLFFILSSFLYICTIIIDCKADRFLLKLIAINTTVKESSVPFKFVFLLLPLRHLGHTNKLERDRQ